MISKDLRVALLPLLIEWNNKDVNLSHLENALLQLHPQTDLLILPETFSTGFPSGMSKDEVREMAERTTGKTIDFIKELARRHQVAICGSFIADTGGSLYNRLF
ncbi:MAG: nitrilase family protein, partial [Muribaculaceae bacterium]|nr:nitrilase family protein [Muribaculaceae bacterium]